MVFLKQIQSVHSPVYNLQTLPTYSRIESTLLNATKRTLHYQAPSLASSLATFSLKHPYPDTVNLLHSSLTSWLLPIYAAFALTTFSIPWPLSYLSSSLSDTLPYQFVLDSDLSVPCVILYYAHHRCNHTKLCLAIFLFPSDYKFTECRDFAYHVHSQTSGLNTIPGTW